MISVGNLAVGGRGKTPAVAALATLLRAHGERPAILSRGYARQDHSDSTVVVRDAEGIRADLARSGDEPLMLARQLDGVVVITGADRFTTGRLAEASLGATVHLLDDGFQHLQLARDLDLVLIDAVDLARPWTLPRGRLREPLDALAAASAVLALDGAAIQPAFTRAPIWPARRRQGQARLIGSAGRQIVPQDGAVIAVAGIASPAGFFDSLRAAGWPLARTLAFRDHHPYSRSDVERIARTAREQGCAMVVTTEKDAVRLLPFRPLPLQVAFVPMTLAIEPAAEFEAWLLEGLARARQRA